jgi:hypothetical protein
VSRAARACGLTALAWLCAGPASACVFDAAIGNPFELAHPRSLEVAMAVYGATQDGRLDPASVGPALDGAAGLQRALWRLQRLGMLLGDAAPGEPAIALVLVDSGLWVRLLPTPLGAAVQSHVAGPAAGDVVAVSSEWVVAHLLSGRLSGQDALAQGLLLLEGDAAGLQRVAARFEGVRAAR